VTRRRLSYALLLAAGVMLGGVATGVAGTDLTQLAQAPTSPTAPRAKPTSPAPAPVAPVPAPTAADPQPSVPEPIGNVATLTGSATVTRNNETTPLVLRDDIYPDDFVATAAKSKLGITFNDATTFNLSANASMTIDSYVYEQGGKQNGAVFDVAKGTIAFVAAAVARTGDMTISTPSATLGIRGTTGLIEVPEGAAAANPQDVAIKLYPDPDGKVGRIEINDRSGTALGALTRGASGFTVRPGIGGARATAVPLVIPPQQVLRDQGFVRQVHSTQNLGRRVVEEQRAFRRANPGVAPNRGNAPGQVGPRRQNGLPGQNRTAPQQPGVPKQQPGQPNRSGQPQQPGQQNRTGQPQQQPGQTNRPGQPQQPGQPNRMGQPQPQPDPAGRPGQPPQQPAVPPRAGQPQQPDVPAPTGAPPPARPQQPNVAPPAAPPPGVQQQGQSRLPGILRGPPGGVRPGLPGRPAPQRRPPKDGKPPKEPRQ
jgi:hypothetical protein